MNCTFDFSTNMEGLFVVMLLFYVKKQPNLPCIVYQIANLDNDYLRGLAYIQVMINNPTLPLVILKYIFLRNPPFIF